jgi:hypothetical protein
MSRKKRSSALTVTTDNIRPSGQITESYELTADFDGISRMDRLILIDQKTGVEWELSISDGNISIEPYELINKRDFRINKVIENGD